MEPSESDKTEVNRETVENELLEFSKFDINRVLKHGERLVGSSGAEYDLPDEELIGECKYKELKNENKNYLFKVCILYNVRLQVR